MTAGLRENSRVKMAIREIPVPTETILLASAVDYLSFLAWTKTTAAQKNRGKPKSIVNALINRSANIMSFTSPEDFLKARERILRGK